MLKNYFISAYRSIVKNKFYSILNIFGPAIGIACAILILLYVKEEVTFDKHNKNYRRIYRLESDFNISGKATLAALTPIPMAPTLKDEYPEIREIARFAGFGLQDILFQYKDLKFFEDKIYFTDSTVFKVFDYEFILGSPDKALNEPNTIVVTESFASRYFGKENPMGEVLTTSNFGNCRVTGVIKDIPANSHLRFDCLLSMATIVELTGVDRFNSRSAPSFWNISAFEYILLDDNAKIEDLLAKFPGFYEKYMSSLGKQINATFRLKATRIDKVHFGSKLEFDLPVGNFNYINNLLACWRLYASYCQPQLHEYGNGTFHKPIQGGGITESYRCRKGNSYQAIHQRIDGAGNPGLNISLDCNHMYFAIIQCSDRQSHKDRDPV